MCGSTYVALLLYKGKKSTFTFTKEKAHVRRKSKRSTPPNKVTQTVHHERAFKSILRERERQRERRARPTVSRFRGAKFYLFFTKKSNKKGRGETCLFLIVLHAFRKVYHILNTHTRTRKRKQTLLNMNTAPPSSSNTSKNYVSIEDMECATLLPRKDDSMIGKKNPSNVSLKNVAYGLGIVALACSGSFVAGRSAAQYKLSGGTSQLGVARLGSKASSVKHSTAHSAAAAKKAKTSLANVGEDEDIKASSVEETTQPADPDTMSKEEMAEEIKQLRGYMTSLVGDEDREV